MGEVLTELIAKIKTDATLLEKGLTDAERKTEASSKKMSESLQKVGIAMVAVGATITAAFGLAIKSAAESQSVRIAFENLASSAGQSSAELLSSLKSASKGTIAEYDLMLSANKAMVLGVAQNSKQFTALMEIARDRARAMGLTTTQAFNDIVTGIGRGSRMILDNLGIIVSLETANENYAKSLKKTAEALTEDEKKQALLNAVLEQGQKTLDETSQNTMTAKETFESLQATIKDLVAGIGSYLLPIFSDVITKIKDVVGNIANWMEENPVLAKTITIITLGLGLLLGALGSAILIIPKLISAWQAFHAVVNLSNVSLIAHKVATIASTIAIKAVTVAQWLWNAALAANPIGLVIAGVAALAAGIAFLITHIKAVKTKYDEWAEAMLEKTDEMKEGINTFFGSWKIKSDAALASELAALEERKDAAQEAHDKAIELINEEYGEFESKTKSKQDLAKEEADTLKSNATNAYNSIIDKIRSTYDTLKKEAREGADVAIASLDRELEAAEANYNAQIALIDELYAAKLKTLNDETRAAIEAVQDQIDAIDAQYEAEKKAAQEVSDAKKIADLEAQIASAETAEERARLEQQLADLLSDINQRRIDEQREAEKESLRQQQEDLRDAAEIQKDILKEEAEAAKLAAEEKLAATQENIEKEKQAIQKGLDANLLAYEKYQAYYIERQEAGLAKEIGNINSQLAGKLTLLEQEKNAKLQAEKDKLAGTLYTIDSEMTNAQILHDNAIGLMKGELAAFKQMNADKISDMENFVSEYNRLLGELGVPVEEQAPVAPEKKTPQQAQEEWIKDRDAWQKDNPMGLPWEGPQFDDYLAKGGMINEPTALLGLNSGQLRLAGESGPERVVPMGATGGVIVNFSQPVFFDREDTMNRFVDMIRRGIQRQDRLRFGSPYSG